MRLKEEMAELSRNLVLLEKTPILGPFPEPEELLRNLISAIEKIGINKIRRPYPPDGRYKAEWEAFQNGQIFELSRGAVRFLCWEPTVSLDKKFIHYLKDRLIPLSPASIQGILKTIHSNWSQIQNHQDILHFVHEQIVNFNGSNLVINKWKEFKSVVVSVTGAQRLADWTFKHQLLIKGVGDLIFLDQQSEFFATFIVSLKNISLERFRQNPDYLFLEVLRWDGWEGSEFKKIISDLILNKHLHQIPDFQQRILNFILNEKRLGDPRLPLNQIKWRGMEEAGREVIRWLSAADIAFFFDHVLPEDRQGRKKFWLDSIQHLQASRPILMYEDEVRLNRVLRETRASSLNFGRMKANTNSAFVLDFGSLIAVEFSKVGMIYFYSKSVFSKVVPNLWSNNHFTEVQLKNKSRAIETIPHIGPWQYRAKAFLRENGITF